MESETMIVPFAIVAFAMYFGVGYGAAWICKAGQMWRIVAGIALPTVLFAICWWHDLHDEGPHGFIYIPARAIWLMPAICLIRLFSAH